MSDSKRETAGYKAVVNMKTTDMVAMVTDGETHGYKPTSTETRPAATPPPAPPTGAGGGSKK